MKLHELFVWQKKSKLEWKVSQNTIWTLNFKELFIIFEQPVHKNSLGHRQWKVNAVGQ